jgi:hypothetical protein
MPRAHRRLSASERQADVLKGGSGSEPLVSELARLPGTAPSTGNGRNGREADLSTTFSQLPLLAQSGSQAEGRFQGGSRRARASTTRRACRIARGRSRLWRVAITAPEERLFQRLEETYLGIASASSEPFPARGELLHA